MSDYTESPVMEMSPEINELALALCKAQGQMESAIKDSANPFFNSTYADLDSVQKAIRKPFADNGLAYVQPISSRGDERLVTTLLMHASGQWIRSTVGETPAKAGAQAAGSVFTYMRRYALSAMAGIAQQDDDGNAASEQVKPAAKKTAISLLKSAKTLPALKAAWERLSPEQHQQIGKDKLTELQDKFRTTEETT